MISYYLNEEDTTRSIEKSIAIDNIDFIYIYVNTTFEGGKSTKRR